MSLAEHRLHPGTKLAAAVVALARACSNWKSGASAHATILNECRRALDEDGSEAIVLGCAGMADLCAHLQDALGVAVGEGLTVAIKSVEALVVLRLGTIKRSGFARPPARQALHRRPAILQSHVAFAS